MKHVVLRTTITLNKILGELNNNVPKYTIVMTFDLLNQYINMKNKELYKLAGVHFSTITKIKKIVGVPRQERQELVL